MTRGTSDSIIYITTSNPLFHYLFISLFSSLCPSLCHSLISFPSSLCRSREVWPYLGAMITQVRVINGCRVRSESSIGQALSQRKCSSVCRLPRGQARSYWLISLKLDLSHEGAGTTERPVTDQHTLTPESHKHHPEQEGISHVKSVSCWGNSGTSTQHSGLPDTVSVGII